MRFRILALTLLFGSLLLGCDSAEDPPPVLQGRYDGTFTYIAPPGPFFPGGPVSESWVLTLTENGRGVVSGAGTLGDEMPVTISGSHDHPDVILDFTDDQGDAAGRFTGTLSDDGQQLDGVYNFTIFFANNPVTLARAPATLLLR